MTIHISARMAWHDNGWNGHICRNPKANTYCVGSYSFPGTDIAEKRDLAWEQSNAGLPCHQLESRPPCTYSINAFGEHPLEVSSDPPGWFNDDTSPRVWKMPPYSVGTWPYEEMYKDEVLNPPRSGVKYNAVKRRQAANEYFAQITPEASLIFYYTNYSNPFSENEEHFYVVTGVSRVKKVGAEITWLDQSKSMEEKYGPNVWMRNITADYPNQGLRLPYLLYMDNPDILECIRFVPENSRHFKYATRHISDDGALGLIERFSEIVGFLHSQGDTSENWSVRQEWLGSVMAELWQNRGIYPGLLRVFDYLKFHEAVKHIMEHSVQRSDQDVKDELFAFVEGRTKSIAGLTLPPKRVKDIQKRWRYLEPEQQNLLRDVLPRFDLQTRQIEQIIENPTEASIHVSPTDMVENPYILCEQYIGLDPDDQITFSQIDHGIFPSPDLGVEFDRDPDDWTRLRALCVEQLQRANQHTFLPIDQVLHNVNHKLSFLPDWKRAQFTQRMVEAEKDDLSAALTYRTNNDHLYLYLKPVFEDERLVENVLRSMANRSAIQLKFPVKEGNWKAFLKRPETDIAKYHPAEYETAIEQQLQVCQQIFQKPISVLCGAAGTGKTTVVTAIIKAIEKAHGIGTSFQLLAPTGKAADRLRERTGKEAQTMHAFLAQRGWLNDNFTFRLRDGQREDRFTTYIVDESSMLDLPLLAAFFRAVNWNAVQRLIFVGDPSQLPPIGTGRVFADLIDWLREEIPGHIGELTTNLRQIQNELTGKGTGILDLASLFIRREIVAAKDPKLEIQDEEMLAKVQEGGDIDGDLRVLYWQDTDQLETLLLNTIIADMEQDTGQKLDKKKPYTLWDALVKQKDGKLYPEATQVISPYRGELFGIERLNQVLQSHKNSWWMEHKGVLGTVTYFDKVIQVVNRPKSHPIRAYNLDAKKAEKVDIYNGEIGMTRIHAFDSKKWKWSGFHIQKVQVIFSRKQHLWVEYVSDSDVTENLELAYAISVHKSQGSEFGRVYFVLPKHKKGLLSRELFYTGITRAQMHCTLLIEDDISPVLALRRPEHSQLARINSSLFQFRPVPAEYQTMNEWYEEGKIHKTLAEQMVRSKSEVIIANILFDRDIPFRYEIPLRASDGTFYLPDFTLTMHGEEWYWEHLGLLENEKYRNHWEIKQDWYKKHGFADRLIVTSEMDGFDSKQALSRLQERIGE